jgi:hypothetical protein
LKVADGVSIVQRYFGNTCVNEGQSCSVDASAKVASVSLKNLNKDVNLRSEILETFFVTRFFFFF